ncbi:dihydroorotate dehydrogenase electron transfer subunit [Rhizobium leguminosarum]|uniref:dihydroorotate dehydrogenase electron transfer subunit n=1 Tax=Rhizobium leguminosarum TaxID=384 RepID=UPI001C967950|nr:dihydroorotate dehydrogenase electron transfer subunit [Rhizobium leguminosarum]MBY5361828.1 dihydroorotate dehydrogenase electron transfer subunit [Rhizobium leguminosarum]MBY5664857.1 dihydroorotate dehydrogenase electron transfer subunit [Rhizobium leguminosarum]MBY5677659.1 dihydroorotate dehydrogenase electron transfer subunit [Rhizobium leguminosarum]MBY5720868.1 dihydroorotate dehydrogenase electron transfer subunit [Rhizobium leguminosarum]
MSASLSAVSDSAPTAVAGHRTVHEVNCRVKRHEWVNGQYRLLVLSAPRSVLDCRPGQFFHLLCPQTDRFRPYFRRPMSIYSYDRANGELSFLYKVAGEGTGALVGLETGGLLNIVGPLGQGFKIRPEWRRPLLVARGVGLATLAPLAQECARLKRPLTAICSARSPDLLMSTDLFRSFGAEVITVTDAEGNSDTERLTPLIEGLIRSRGIDAFFTCGSARLMRMLQEIGARHGIGGQVALEQHMACGIGMCQACVRPFKRKAAAVNLRVCREGPVFDLQEVL